MKKCAGYLGFGVVFFIFLLFASAPIIEINSDGERTLKTQSEILAVDPPTATSTPVPPTPTNTPVPPTPTPLPDKVTICHKPNKQALTLSVSKNAVPAHLRHGDHLGPCDD